MDKIEKIRKFVKELQQDFISIQPKDCSLELIKSYAGYAYLDKVLSFLDTLSEEPDKSLEEAVKNYFQGYFPGTETVEQCNTDLHFTPPAIIRLARHFAQWGAEHLRDTTKMIDKSLEEAAEAYQEQVIEETKNHIHLPQCTYAEGFEDALRLILDAYIAGAEWKKDALLEWLKEKISDYWADGENEWGIYPYAFEEVINKLNEM